MAQSRRKSKRKTRRSSSGFGIFVMGVIVGSLGTVLGRGFFDDSPNGSGLSSLLHEPTHRSSSVTSGQTVAVTDDSPGFKFDYRELLMEEEYVLQMPARENRTDSKEQLKDGQSEVDTVTRQSTAEDSAAAEAKEKTAPAVTQSNPAADSGSAYIIQIGSFRKFGDADRIKATLAINGLETYIQKVSIEGRGDFFRVRMGPFRQYGAVEATMDRLTKLDHQPLVFRVKASG